MRFIYCILPLTLFFLSCSTDSQPDNQLTDADGNTYETVIIGEQEWMAENLRTSKYNNGTPIHNLTDINEWEKFRSGAWVYYDNIESNDEIYGKLYNQFAVLDNRGICPEGWKVPSMEDWERLIESVNSLDQIKETSPQWDGNNELGFSALPAGGLEGPWSTSANRDWFFLNMGETPYWWTSSSASEHYSSWGLYITVSRRNSLEVRGNPSSYGYSVRCLRD